MAGTVPYRRSRIRATRPATRPTAIAAPPASISGTGIAKAFADIVNSDATETTQPISFLIVGFPFQVSLRAPLSPALEMLRRSPYGGGPNLVSPEAPEPSFTLTEARARLCKNCASTVWRLI